MTVLSVDDTRNPDYKIVNFEPDLNKESKTAILHESRPVASKVLDKVPEGYTMSFIERQ